MIKLMKSGRKSEFGRRCWVLATVVAAAFAPWGNPLRADSTLSAAAGYEVERKDLYTTYERMCRLEHADPVHVLAPMDGTVKTTLTEGADVAADAVIATFDMAETNRDLTLARSQLATLEKRIDVQSGPLIAAQRRLHELDLSAAERRLQDAQDVMAKARELAEQGRLADVRLAEAEQVVRNVNEELSRLELQFSVRELENQLLIENLRDNELSQRINIDRLVQLLSQSEVTAPTAGRISYINPQLTFSGQSVVRAGSHLFSVASQDRRWARVGLTAAEAERLRDATVAIRDSDGTEYPASSRGIRFRADANAWQKEQFEALFIVEAVTDGLFLGDEVTCIFRQSVATQALVIPYSLIVLDGGAQMVRVVSGDTVELREISTGHLDLPMIEVTAGLNEGDKIK